MRSARAVAAKKQRLVARGEPAEDRPRARIVLGNERAGESRADGKDVQPGDVVRGYEHRMRRCVPGDLQAYTKRVEQLPAPPGANRRALPGNEQRIEELHQRDAERQMQGEPRETNDPAQAWSHSLRRECEKRV